MGLGIAKWLMPTCGGGGCCFRCKTYLFALDLVAIEGECER